MTEVMAPDILVEDPQGVRVLVVAGVDRAAVDMLVMELSGQLRDAGWVVEIGNAVTGKLPPPPDYDAIVIVASAWARWGAIARYVEWFRESLSDLPVVVALVGSHGDPAAFCARVLGWRPSLALAVESAHKAPDRARLLRSATRVAGEVIALHARAKLII